MARSAKLEEREVEEEEEKEKVKEGETQKQEMVETVQRVHQKSVHDEDEKEREVKGKQEKSKTLQSQSNIGEILEVALSLFLLLGQNWRSVSAAAEGPRRRTEAVMRVQQEVQIKECRWTKERTQKVEAVKRGRTELK